MKKKLICAAALLTAAFAWAAGGSESYRVIASAPSLYRSTGLSSADSLDWSSPIATSGATATVLETGGNPNLLLNGSFSWIGATVTVKTGLWHKDNAGTWTFMGIADVSTLTASTSEFWDGTEYVSESPLLIDTAGAPYVEARIAAVSSGTVELKPILFGSDTR